MSIHIPPHNLDPRGHVGRAALTEKHKADHAEVRGHLWWRQVRVVCRCGAASPWVQYRPSLGDDDFRFSPGWFERHRGEVK